MYYFYQLYSQAVKIVRRVLTILIHEIVRRLRTIYQRHTIFLSLPLGISQYERSKLIPKEIKSSLPSIEQIESTLEQLSENSED